MLQPALQLYTIRAVTATGMLDALGRVAEAGYTRVELAGYGDASPAAIRGRIDALGMQAISAHIPLSRWENEPEQVIDDLHTLGCWQAVIPWLEPDRRTADGITALVRQLDRIGQRLADEGLILAYHNHEFEFERSDGPTMFERLVRETDPQVVAIELDIGWAWFGGEDPVELLQMLEGRVPAIHVKDFTADRQPVTSGDGAIDWPQVLEAALAAGARAAIVENDHPVDPIDDIVRARQNLDRLLAGLDDQAR